MLTLPPLSIRTQLSARVTWNMELAILRNQELKKCRPGQLKKKQRVLMPFYFRIIILKTMMPAFKRSQKLTALVSLVSVQTGNISPVISSRTDILFLKYN